MSVLALCLPLGLALAAPEPLELPPAPPPPSARRNASQALPDGVDFGSDVAVGYLVGSLLGNWMDDGVHGVVSARYDAFVRSRAQSGWRLGLGLWGSTVVEPVQTGTNRDETGDTTEVRYRQFGAMTSLRGDPELPISPLLGIGLSRLDLLEGYYGGPQALPLLTFEGGARQNLSPTVFLDYTVRSHWGTARSGLDETLLEEWWLVQGGLQLGVRVR